MVESALRHARILQDHDFHEFKISVKASDIFMTVAAYQLLAEAIDCPLHLGVTEAGRAAHRHGEVSIGMARCSGPGIGDTIRVSLAADPVEEIKVGFDLLKSLGLRHRASTSSPALLRAAGLQRDQDRRGAGGQAGAHLHAHEPLDHRLRRERSRARP
jgi:4-hydroxy-3-methylbut-2-en-1-yl diphosphate synthase IspG/GcpE